LLQYALQAGTLSDYFVELVRGDELLFEVGLLLFASPQGFFSFLPLCQITNHTQHHAASRCFHRAKHDIDWKLTSVLAAAIQLEPGTHRAHAGMGGIVGSTSRM
jgi:hypothetical protein